MSTQQIFTHNHNLRQGLNKISSKTLCAVHVRLTANILWQCLCRPRVHVLMVCVSHMRVRATIRKTELDRRILLFLFAYFSCFARCIDVCACARSTACSKLGRYPRTFTVIWKSKTRKVHKGIEIVNSNWSWMTIRKKKHTHTHVRTACTHCDRVRAKSQ